LLASWRGQLGSHKYFRSLEDGTFLCIWREQNARSFEDVMTQEKAHSHICAITPKELVNLEIS
jgi:hypothetical protein